MKNCSLPSASLRQNLVGKHGMSDIAMNITPSRYKQTMFIPSLLHPRFALE